ncbi:MAG: DUF2202 domain-containing protein [Sphaerochaetaceae bacterium]
MRKLVIMFVILLVSVSVFLSAQPISEQQVLPSQEIEKVTIDGLFYMAEEEKLARDVYLTLYEIWGNRVFFNIASAEQQHMNAIAAVMEDKSLENPTFVSEIGVFNDEEIAKLYESLVEQGSTSLTAAFLVGAIIEDLDIYDLQRSIETTDDAAEIRVYNNLLRGSENHMRSFVKQLNRYGEDYSAHYISDAELSAILSRK